MRRLLAWLLTVLLVTTPAFAQIIDTQFVGALSTNSNCAVVQSCASFNVQGSSSITLQLVGTASATVTFEGTADGQTWATVLMTALVDGTTATTATASGQWAISNTGLQGLRARVTTYASGGYQVTATMGRATARLMAPSFTRLFVANGTQAAPSIAFTSAPTTGLLFLGTGVGVAVGGASRIRFDSTATTMISTMSIGWAASTDPAAAQDTSLTRAGVGEIGLTAILFAALGTPSNGAIAYCSDCTETTPATCPVTQASCICAGSGTGAFARRINGAWYCTF